MTDPNPGDNPAAFPEGRAGKGSAVWIAEAAGALFIISAGTLLHYVFDLFGRWPPLALIAAVNESVWEHLKLAFWPAVIFGLAARPWLRSRTTNYWTAKGFGIFVMPLLICAFFYSHKLIFGQHNLAYDITTYVIAVTAGQMLSARLMRMPPLPRKIRILAAGLLAAALLAFSLFTFFPPRLPVFRDGRTGEYGIPSETDLKSHAHRHGGTEPDRQPVVGIGIDLVAHGIPVEISDLVVLHRGAGAAHVKDVEQQA